MLEAGFQLEDKGKGMGEGISKLNWTWQAVYIDGKLDQFEGRTEHQFNEIDQHRLVVFMLVSNQSAIGINLIDGKFYLEGVDLNIEPSVPGPYKLIYFRRNRQQISQGNPTGPKEVTHHIGWQTEGSSEMPNHQRILMVKDTSAREFSIFVK